jgi:hypothetical protein
MNRIARARRISRVFVLAGLLLFALSTIMGGCKQPGGC